MINNNYWNNFYTFFNEKEPSSFAKWISTKNIIKQDSKVIDIGCGNGRDTKYLSTLTSSIVGIDSAIINNVDFNFIQSDINDIIKEECKYDIVYSRFFFHSIPQNITYDILKWNTGILLAEFRVEDDIPIIYTDHKRYIVDNKWFSNVLNDLYDVEFCEISKDLAIYKEENPIIMRVIAKKKVK